MRGWLCTWVLVAGGLAFVAAGVHAADEKQPDSVNLLNTKCINCHTNARWDSKEFTPEQWKEILLTTQTLSGKQ